jgi:hypothetical protein
MANLQELNTVHSHLQRSKLKDKIHNLRAWAMDTFLTPVKPVKCDHEFKLRKYSIFRIGKYKYANTSHYCTKCKVIKNTNHKY